MHSLYDFSITLKKRFSNHKWSTWINSWTIPNFWFSESTRGAPWLCPFPTVAEWPDTALIAFRIFPFYFIFTIGHRFHFTHARSTIVVRGRKGREGRNGSISPTLHGTCPAWEMTTRGPLQPDILIYIIPKCSGAGREVRRLEEAMGMKYLRGELAHFHNPIEFDASNLL